MVVCTMASAASAVSQFLAKRDAAVADQHVEAGKALLQLAA